MFTSRSSAVFVLLLFVSIPAAAFASGPAPAMFEVSGTLEPASAGLRVRLRARNAGGLAASGLQMRGQLLGERAVASVAEPVATGASAEAVLDLPRLVTVPGLHALAVRLDYECAMRADAPREPFSQWAYLLLGFGASRPPAVAIALAPMRFEETGRLPVRLRSADGQPHRVRLSLHVPRALGAVPERQIVSVPAAGETTATVRLFRGLSEARSHGVLALAVTEDEEIASTSAGVGVVEVAGDPALLPRLGLVSPLLAIALLAVAAVAEWRRAVLRSPTV